MVRLSLVLFIAITRLTEHSYLTKMRLGTCAADERAAAFFLSRRRRQTQCNKTPKTRARKYTRHQCLPFKRPQKSVYDCKGYDEGSQL